MKINFTEKTHIPAFKAARISINALSDTHGELERANSALEPLRMHKDTFFYSGEKGNYNVLAVCGDWFMDGARRGFKCSPDTPLAYFQKEIFNKFISGIKNIAENTAVLFTPGNHEFDGGVPLLDDILSSLNAKILITNLDIKNSYGFKNAKYSSKLTNQFTLTVQDDKNPDLKHKILFLGIAPVNLQFYQKNLNGVNMLDNSLKPQLDVTEEDYKNSLNECIRRIQKFKLQNPRGLAVILCHTGVGFADKIALKAPVDLIFDGHEHKDGLRTSNKTPIVPLYMNFQKIFNAKLELDDDGKLKDIQINDLIVDDKIKTGMLADLYQRLFEDDIKKIYTLKSSDNNIKTLSIEGVRCGNNHLANFITDSVLEELKKEDESIDFAALNSSAIRHPLALSSRPSVSRMDIMNVLAGIKEDEAQIMTSDLKGADIAYLVLDNILTNLKNPEKNSLIQYSGLIIDRTNILKKMETAGDLKELCSFIKDKKTNEPLIPDKTYKIANTEKYFNKSINTKIRNLKDSSAYTGFSVQELFRRHFETSSGSLTVNFDVRVY